MRHFLYIFLPFVLCLPIFSQNNEQVYLKNGSVVNGKIIEIKPDSGVRLLTPDNSQWVFAMSDIEKIELSKSTFIGSTQKFHILCDIGFLAGTVENEMKAPLSFLSSFHYNLYKGIHVGLGTGLEFYQMTYMPFFADLRFKPSAGGLSVFFQAGKAIPLNKRGKIYYDEYVFGQGILLNPGISYTFNTNHREAFTVSIGYRYQETRADRVHNPQQYYYYQNYSIINRLNRFNIRFGYVFR